MKTILWQGCALLTLMVACEQSDTTAVEEAGDPAQAGDTPIVRTIEPCSPTNCFGARPGLLSLSCCTSGEGGTNEGGAPEGAGGLGAGPEGGSMHEGGSNEGGSMHEGGSSEGGSAEGGAPGGTGGFCPSNDI